MSKLMKSRTNYHIKTSTRWHSRNSFLPERWFGLRSDAELKKHPPPTMLYRMFRWKNKTPPIPPDVVVKP